MLPPCNFGAGTVLLSLGCITSTKAAMAILRHCCEHVHKFVAHPDEGNVGNTDLLWCDEYWCERSQLIHLEVNA